MKKIFLLILIVVSGCQSAPKACVGCEHDLYLWKVAVDTVVHANFPDEEYNAVVHYADFSNAWVTTGNDIHITDDLLHQLTTEQRVAVAAHEIGHLKAGHYYSKIGISILTSIVFSAANLFVSFTNWKNADNARCVLRSSSNELSNPVPVFLII